MTAENSITVPKRLVVKKIIAARYDLPEKNTRPSSWDRRTAGVDRILTSENQEINLQSDGGQSVPQPGWIIMLTERLQGGSFLWTLYGFERK